MFQKLSIFTIAIAAMAAGYWFSTNLDKTDSAATIHTQQFSKIQGYILDPARFIAIPPLQKDDGSLFVNDDLKNHWSLLFFGYTHCPDICPITMNVLAQSAKQAEAQKVMFPDVFFISVDPQRDSIEILGEYVRYFDRSFTGVTGKPKMLEALTLQAGIAYMKPTTTAVSGGNYIVDHSASILLINPQGRLAAYLKPPHTPESILKSVSTVRMTVDRKKPGT